MNHEIVGPEMTVVTGQLRLPKREAIALHIAQYSTKAGEQAAAREAKQDEINRLNKANRRDSLPDSLDKIEQGIVNNLILVGNVEMAQEVILHKWKVRDQHPELFEVMTEMDKQDLGSEDPRWVGFRTILSKLKKKESSVKNDPMGLTY